MMAHPAEVTAMLRDGHLVSVGLGWSPIHDDAGSLSVEMMSAAISASAAVLPVATRGREWGRTWRVRIGPPVGSVHDRRRHSAASAAVDVREAVRAEATRLKRRA